MTKNSFNRGFVNKKELYAVAASFSGGGGGSSIANNFAATVDPTINDDITNGWSKASFWKNNSNGKIYVCSVNTEGAAVWDLLNTSSMGGITSEIQEFTDINGETDGIVIEHDLGYYPLAQLILDSEEEGGDKESSLIDQHISVNSFRANWLGVRSGSVIYYH